MPGFDIDAALRWARFDPQRGLARRDDDALPFARAEDPAGRSLLLDTCVYIDRMQGRAPPVVDRLVRSRQVNHSTVAIQEMMHAVGVLNPRDPRTIGAIAAIRARIEAMPDHRVLVPDAEVACRAALLAGMLARLQGYARDARARLLHDCILFLQAQKLGLTVLTANIADFDLLLQLVPTGRALFYRCAQAPLSR